MASERAGVSGIAERYAIALLDLAGEQNALDRVAQDLVILKGLLAGSVDLQRLVRSPLLRRDAQGRAVAAVAKAAGFSTTTEKFLGLVAANRRLFALPRMADLFLEKLAEMRGETVAHVATAHPLTQSQLDAVTAVLQRSVGVHVKVETKVDAALLGGMVVKVGSRLVDSSLRTKLQRLEQMMKGVA